ncbi:hypothetical protein [Mycobacterium sp.]|uniref:hypothetical protein n=1 Tax=Mycobacterium sp. TaxID=1785 RepID=UPI0031D2616E
MTHETLKVNHEKLAEAGGRLAELADNMPKAPAAFAVSGNDPLSAAIAAQVPKIEEPIVGP